MSDYSVGASWFDRRTRLLLRCRPAHPTPMTDAVFPPSNNPPASVHDLIRFHARHKLLLMAHAPATVSALGRLVAGAGSGGDLVQVWEEYQTRFQATLAMPASRGGHVNALLHAVGYFRGIDDATRHEVVRAIELFAAGASSLASPIRLIRMHADRLGITYLTDQVYFKLPSTLNDR